MQLGERLRELREHRGLSGRAAATYLQISNAHVSDLENGKAKPSIELLIRLAEYYKTSADYLLGLEAPPPEEFTQAQRQAADLLAALPLALQPYALAALNAMVEEWKQAGAKMLASLLADQHAMRAAAGRSGESVEIEGEAIPGSELLSLLYAVQQRVEGEHT